MSKTNDQNQLIPEAKMQFLLESFGIPCRFWRVDPARIKEKKILDRLFLDNLPENIYNGFSLILMGEIGVGKSSMLSYIAREAVLQAHKPNSEFFEDGFWGAYVKIRFIAVSEFCARVLEHCDNDEYYWCKLLLLDDFGTEHMSSYAFSNLERLIDHRYAHQLSTCITTNLSIETLLRTEMYARLVDRWRQKDAYGLITIEGESRRRKPIVE